MKTKDPLDKVKVMTMTKKLLVTLAALVCSTAGVVAQDLAAGETVFKKCKACHSVGEGAKNKVGPELNGLDGRQSGTVEGYEYSEANRNSGIVWNEAEFLVYIKDPKARIPGTKMTFAGIKNDADAIALWAFLSRFGPDGIEK